jgi:hypothetical protein
MQGIKSIVTTPHRGVATAAVDSLKNLLKFGHFIFWLKLRCFLKIKGPATSELIMGSLIFESDEYRASARR